MCLPHMASTPEFKLQVVSDGIVFPFCSEGFLRAHVLLSIRAIGGTQWIEVYTQFYREPSRKSVGWTL